MTDGQVENPVDPVIVCAWSEWKIDWLIGSMMIEMRFLAGIEAMDKNRLASSEMICETESVMTGARSMVRIVAMNQKDAAASETKMKMSEVSIVQLALSWLFVAFLDVLGRPPRPVSCKSYSLT